MFKSRAVSLEKSLKAQGIVVEINKVKPRKGAFVVSAKVGTIKPVTLLELIDMPRPFTKLKAVDFDVVATDVIKAVDKLEAY